MTNIQDALDGLYREAQQSQDLIMESEDARAIAIVLVNLFTINTAGMMMLGAAIHAHGDDNLKEIANLIGDIADRAFEEVDTKVDTWALMNKVPDAEHVFEGLDLSEFDFDSLDNAIDGDDSDG